MEENEQANRVKTFIQPTSPQLAHIPLQQAGSGQFEACITCRAACNQGTVPRSQNH